jgi:acyl-CoA synthetase (AMP-forming)/AMP-acid ligase II
MFELQPQAVEEAARRAAGSLRELGLRAGDRVAVVAENHPDYLALTIGALRSGVVPVLVNVHLAQPDRDWILSDADPMLVVDELGRGGGTRAELAPWPLARPMHYTSGTTGRSKGVWSGVLSEDDASALAADESELWGAGPGDTMLVCSPLYHSAPHRSAMSALLRGARVLIAERFDADEIVRAFRTDGVTHAFLVPTHLRRLLAAGLRAPSAKRVLVAGEPCPEALKRRAMEAIPPLFEFYGSTEGQFTLISPAEWLEHPGSVGRARAGRELDIADPGPDGVGRVWVSAPSFARWEYWRSPQRTAQAWRGDRFTVGDLGHLDADGYLYLDGRREDLIISGGVNVYPAEVERVLLEHPGVTEAAVFGVPDDEFGQRVCAAIVGDADPDEILRWARRRLPGSHRPKQVSMVDALPRTTTGKVRRSDLAG